MSVLVWLLSRFFDDVSILCPDLHSVQEEITVQQELSEYLKNSVPGQHTRRELSVYWSHQSRVDKYKRSSQGLVTSSSTGLTAACLSLTWPPPLLSFPTHLHNSFLQMVLRNCPFPRSICPKDGTPCWCGTKKDPPRVLDGHFTSEMWPPDKWQ